MIDKFKIPLTWHNCKSYPPKEAINLSLVVTNGNKVYTTSWYKDVGYHTERGLIKKSELKKWYWADLEQTVKGCSEFKGE